MAYRKRNEIEENLLKNESNQKRLVEREGVNIIKSLDCLLALSEGTVIRFLYKNVAIFCKSWPFLAFTTQIHLVQFLTKWSHPVFIE